MTSPGAMTVEEREAFLSEVHVGVLSVVEASRGPLSLPIWYQFVDGDIVMGMDGGSLKARLLRDAGRATLVAQTEEAPYKFVIVEGPVTIEDDSTRDDLSMATRYLRPEMGAWYAENNPSGASSVLVRLTPEHWRTTDFAKLIG